MSIYTVNHIIELSAKQYVYALMNGVSEFAGVKGQIDKHKKEIVEGMKHLVHEEYKINEEVETGIIANFYGQHKLYVINDISQNDVVIIPGLRRGVDVFEKATLVSAAYVKLFNKDKIVVIIFNDERIVVIDEIFNHMALISFLESKIDAIKKGYADAEVFDRAFRGKEYYILKQFFKQVTLDAERYKKIYGCAYNLVTAAIVSNRSSSDYVSLLAYGA